MSVDGEDLVDRWDRRLQQGVKTAPDVTPEDCAMRFDSDLDIEELCNEALEVAISDGAGKIEMAHFEEAEERLGDEPDEEDDVGHSLPPEPTDDGAEEDVDDTDTDDVDQEADPEPVDDAVDEDVQEPSGNPALSQIQARLDEIDERLATMEGQVDKLQDVANRDVVLLRTAVANIAAPDGIDDTQEIVDASQMLRDELDDLMQLVDDQRSGAEVADGGEQISKKKLAKEISLDEVLRRAGKGNRGGAIEWADVQQIAERERDVELNSGTVYDAWEVLVERWDAFSIRDGEPGPHTPNKRLQVDRDELPPSLRSRRANGGDDA